MNQSFSSALRAHRIGILLSVVAILSGFVLGGVFGALEEDLKAGLQRDALAVVDTTYQGDEEAAQKVVDKAWVYYKRAHMHWGGIGAATLALALCVAGASGGTRAARIATAMTGLGAVAYPAFWLLAGRRAPGLGGTGAAKESLEWLAVPSSGLLLLGTATTLVLLAARFFGSPAE